MKITFSGANDPSSRSQTCVNLQKHGFLHGLALTQNNQLYPRRTDQTGCKVTGNEEQFGRSELSRIHALPDTQLWWSNIPALDHVCFTLWDVFVLRVLKGFQMASQAAFIAGWEHFMNSWKISQMLQSRESNLEEPRCSDVSSNGGLTG